MLVSAVEVLRLSACIFFAFVVIITLIYWGNRGPPEAAVGGSHLEEGVRMGRWKVLTPENGVWRSAHSPRTVTRQRR